MMGDDLRLLVGELFKGNPAGRYKLDCLHIIFSFQETTLLYANQWLLQSCQLTLWSTFIDLFMHGNVHEAYLRFFKKGEDKC